MINIDELTEVVETRLDSNKYSQLGHEAIGATIRLFRRSKQFPLRFEVQIDGAVHDKPEDIYITGDYSTDWSVVFGIRPVEARRPWQIRPDRQMNALTRIFAGMIMGPQAMHGDLIVDDTWMPIFGELPVESEIPSIINTAEVTGNEPMAPIYISEYVYNVRSSWHLEH